MGTSVWGICGGSGSGKTTLTRRIVAAIGPERVGVISFDSYYRDLDDLTIQARQAVNFDHPDSLDVELFVEHLQILRAGGAVDVPLYDFATHTRSGAVERVGPVPLVIAEGILLFSAPELRNCFDRRIFRDAPASVRLSRRIERDVAERGRTELTVREQWEKTVAPMHDAFVQPNAAFADRIVEYGENLDEVVAELAKDALGLVGAT